VRTVNLKEGMPAVSEGLARLEKELLQARDSGVGLLRIIHGYGSGGIGGSLKAACRRCLREMLDRRQVKSILPGEEYSAAGGAGSQLVNRYPALKESRRTDEGNPGITFVEL
jgi:DNA-nicking Smr family endonuclease